MTEEQINKAFENRWRIYGNYGQINKNAALMCYDEFFDYIKGLCHNFFTAGIMIAERYNQYIPLYDVKQEVPLTPEDALQFHQQMANDMLSFDTFWNAYDKKVGRPKCEKLWEKLTSQERMQCLNYIPLYKEAQPDKQYRKNPETFLRNKSWNDEIIFRNGTDKQQQQRDRLTDVANRIAEYTKDAK